MVWCQQCDRYFASNGALQQHFDNAEVHRVYVCTLCNQDFNNESALSQHEKNSLKHLKRLWKFVCDPCKWGCSTEAQMEKHDHQVHLYCSQHRQSFQNENNLRQHLNSKAHGVSKSCPFCRKSFPTFSAITSHLEAGTCSSGMNRRMLDQMVHAKDTGGMVTDRKRIGYGNWEPEPDVWATSNAWNGYAYECYFCDNQYSSLPTLNGHITRFHAAPRTENLYHCPCCDRQFKLFSQVMAHIDHTNSCRVKENRRSFLRLTY